MVDEKKFLEKIGLCLERDAMHLSCRVERVYDKK